MVVENSVPTKNVLYAQQATIHFFCTSAPYSRMHKILTTLNKYIKYCFVSAKSLTFKVDFSGISNPQFTGCQKKQEVVIASLKQFYYITFFLF